MDRGLTAGAMLAKEPMMKSWPPKKKPTQAYHEILHFQQRLLEKHSLLQGCT